MSSSIATDPAFSGPPLFVAVCGSSGVGKTTFVDALTARFPHRFRRAKSVTTRKRREGEGLAEYDFISEADFENLIEAGSLLNTDRVHGNWYGISAEQVRATVALGLIPVKEMAAKNVAQLGAHGLLPIIAYIEAPSPVTVRPGRDATDEAELGTMPTAEIVSFRVMREEQGAAEMGEQFRRWMDAALVMGGMGAAARTHSLAWDDENRIGYDAIAPEFTEDLRVTTAYFHTLSGPFWLEMRDNRLIGQGSYLEVAPGRGWLADYLDLPPHYSYRGLELSQVMRRLNPRADQIDIGSAASMPYRSATFDGVLGSLVDPFLNASFLAEAHRVLRPGGWLAFTTPASDWAMALRGEVGAYQTTFVRSDGSPTNVGSACSDPTQLREALGILGFANVQVTGVGVTRDTIAAAPAVKAALDRLPPAIRELAVVTTCIAEKAK